MLCQVYTEMSYYQRSFMTTHLLPLVLVIISQTVIRMIGIHCFPQLCYKANERNCGVAILQLLYPLNITVVLHGISYIITEELESIVFINLIFN